MGFPGDSAFDEANRIAYEDALDYYTFYRNRNLAGIILVGSGLAWIVFAVVVCMVLGTASFAWTIIASVGVIIWGAIYLIQVNLDDDLQISKRNLKIAKRSWSPNENE